MKKIAVIISGCGVYDGAEIHEATLSLYAIKKSGAQYSIFAPDIFQHDVINHLTGEVMNERRNVLVESARIARGAIRPLKDFSAADFDALILPGGYGVAKHLSTFASEGADFKLLKDLEKAVLAMHSSGKPIGALCIAPVLIAKMIPGVELTIGQDAATASIISTLGARHIPSLHSEVVIDARNKIYTTSCYMLDSDIVQVAEGVMNIVAAIMKDIS